MPPSMAGLHGERGGWDSWKRVAVSRFCEAAGLPVRRRHLWGERGKAPWLPPGSARRQPQPIKAAGAQLSTLFLGSQIVAFRVTQSG